MDMDVFDAIARRRSYRGPFLDRPVPREDIEKILRAAAAAPSGCNKELTRFVAVDDPKLCASLGALLDMPAVRTAPAHLVVVGDQTPVYADMTFEMADTAACVMNAWLAMTALGYATVWLDGNLRGGIDQRISGLLGIPDTLTARILLPFGVPAGPFTPIRKKAWTERSHFNRW